MVFKRNRVGYWWETGREQHLHELKTNLYVCRKHLHILSFWCSSNVFHMIRGHNIYPTMGRPQHCSPLSVKAVCVCASKVCSDWCSFRGLWALGTTEMTSTEVSGSAARLWLTAYLEEHSRCLLWPSPAWKTHLVHGVKMCTCVCTRRDTHVRMYW